MTTRERTVWETVTVKVKVFYWKTIKLNNGKTKRVRKAKYAPVQKRVARTITELVPGPRLPCYGSGVQTPSGYVSYVQAVHALAHETIHILDYTIGSRLLPPNVAEQRAECFGMQLSPQLAVAFGAKTMPARWRRTTTSRSIRVNKGRRIGLPSATRMALSIRLRTMDSGPKGAVARPGPTAKTARGGVGYVQKARLIHCCCPSRPEVTTGPVWGYGAKSRRLGVVLPART